MHFDNPCYGCEQRSATCAASCEAWAAHKANNLLRYREKARRHIAEDYTVRECNKSKWNSKKDQYGKKIRGRQP